MMPVVDVPDVGEVEFPDDMSPSEIEAALKSHYPADRATQKLRLADEMSKLRRQGFLGEQGQAVIGAAENIARVASIPATPILRLPRSEGGGVGSGLLNVGANVAESLSAPAYWLIPGSKPLQALVAGQTLGSVPQSTVRAAQTLLNPLATKAQKVEAVADPLLAAGAGALITKGAIRANDQIESPSGIPVEQQGVPVDRPAESQSETGTPQRGSEGEQAIPQPSEVSNEVKVPPSVAAAGASPEAPSVSAAEVPVAAGAEPAKVEPNVTPEVTQVGEATPLSQGPGAASPGDVPPEPRMADAIENNPEVRPLGPTSPASIGINNAINGVWDWVKGVAGQSMPKTTTADRAVGEAGVRYASSRIAAKPLADSFAAHALEGTDVDPVKFGAALTEDNLRSVRESLRQKATELGANGDLEGAALAADKGNQVASIIGAKGSPFKTEDAYFDFLSDPATQKAIGQHVQLWKEIIEPQYKQAQSLDPNIELPTRGQQTGARINLKAILPDDPATRPVSGVGSPNLTGTLKKKTPFSITAKGTGQAYDINYGDIIANTFTRQLEIANKNAFDDALVKSGNAVIDSPGQTISLKGEPAVPFPIVRKSIVTGGQTIPMSQNIYVRKSLASEYRTASNVNERHSLGFVTKVMGGINRLALAGLTDFSVHTSNLLTAIFNRPTSAKLFGDTLLSATGRADIPVTLTKAILKGLRDNREQVAELSNIGAIRPQEPSGWAGRILRSVDKTTRLVLDDTFKSLAKEGIVPDTETARREYVNQVGQYNRRLQGPLTRWLRETGFGPFVTAGKTFNALGVKMATLSPGSKAISLPAAAALRANVLSKWVGASVLVGTLNYLLTKKVGGRPGTPIGSVDFGTNDKTGKQQSFPLFSLIGLGRGLRVTGIKGFAEAKRLGLSTADAIDTMARDIFNSWVAPAAGPPVKALVVAGSGYPPAVKVGRASRVAPPGSSQLAENVKEAAIEVNPLVQSISKVREGKPVSEAISGQLPRLSMTPGKSEGMVANYPKIVTMARANEFTEDVIFQARRLPFEERRAFVTEQINRLPPELRQKARNEVARRKVYNR